MCIYPFYIPPFALYILECSTPHHLISPVPSCGYFHLTKGTPTRSSHPHRHSFFYQFFQCSRIFSRRSGNPYHVSHNHSDSRTLPKHTPICEAAHKNLVILLLSPILSYTSPVRFLHTYSLKYPSLLYYYI